MNNERTHRTWRQPAGTSQCLIHAIDFQASTFSTARFAMEKINAPVHIRRSVLKRQCEYFHGRLAARHALLAIGVGETNIGSDALRAPVFPAAVVGSISHIDSLAIAAVMPSGQWNGLGLDVERRMAAPDLADAATVFLCAEEERVLRSAALPYEMAATMAFSAKESFYKAVSRHCGRVLEFSALRLQAIDASNAKLHFVVAEPVCAEWPEYRHLSVDYALLDAATVCTVFLW
ncbi:4'-phosphopantetheinyl transferase [Duganella sp. CT11-25]|uniref:4'-phosphopantetheinyl transferase family protein n=1 Tax=unclassified Duganella TaxID=2636909 RepID=UPI0039B0BB8B